MDMVLDVVSVRWELSTPPLPVSGYLPSFFNKAEKWNVQAFSTIYKYVYKAKLRCKYLEESAVMVPENHLRRVGRLQNKKGFKMMQ